VDMKQCINSIMMVLGIRFIILQLAIQFIQVIFLGGLQDNGLILIEDYWQLSIGQWENDKLVVAVNGNKVRVVSGMELDYPDYIEDVNTLIQEYDHLLLVGRIESKIKLKLPDLKWNPSISTERFQIVSADLK